MKAFTFFIVDVFAEKKYAGNQLAVFRDAGNLSDEEMQLFAKEMNYSETTFIL
jgi:trans-2,3-dihydro-3-hydroxyanthranilate isomerase